MIIRNLKPGFNLLLIAILSIAVNNTVFETSVLDEIVRVEEDTIEESENLVDSFIFHYNSFSKGSGGSGDIDSYSHQTAVLSEKSVILEPISLYIEVIPTKSANISCRNVPKYILFGALKLCA